MILAMELPISSYLIFQIVLTLAVSGILLWQAIKALNEVKR